jgi:integrase
VEFEHFGAVDIDDDKGLMFWLETQDGPKLCYQQAYRGVWNRTLKGLGLWVEGKPLYTPHGLRHYFVSTALVGGVSLLEVSRWIGHRSISVTADIYGHLTPDATPNLIRVMNAALRPSDRALAA